MTEGWQQTMAQAYEKLKAQVRAKVEHPFHVVKNLFHYEKSKRPVCTVLTAWRDIS